MSRVVPRVMVLQPLFTTGAPIDLRVLGVQFWLTDQLASLGFEAASGLFSDPRVPHEKRLVAVTPPTDAQVLEKVAENRCHFALLTSLELDPDPRLTFARVFNTKGPTARIECKGDLLPVATHGVLVKFLQAIGLEVDAPPWQEMFGTHDVAGATSYLGALGAHAMCDQGFRIDNARGALQALRAALSCAMPPAFRLLPHLVAGLRATRSGEDELLREELRAAVASVHVTPPDWAPTLSELGLTPHHHVN